MLTGARRLIAEHWRLRRILYSSAKVELHKRYAGSMLGALWTILYPLLFLSVYLFLWLVVFKVRFPGFSGIDYVVFVFGGLVPYLFLVDSVTAGVVSIRQNVHLVKSVILPIELIPTRAVAVALVGHAVGLALVVALGGASDGLSWRIALLPFIVALQVLGVTGLCWIVAPLGVLIPDVAYVINLLVMVLMFVSPIAFRPEMVPAALRAVVWLNPVTYMAESYRLVLLRDAAVSREALTVFVLGSVVTFVIGAAFCARFKGFVVDFE